MNVDPPIKRKENMKTRKVVQIILGVISLVPLLFIAAGIANEVKLARLRNHGIVVQGRVVEGGVLSKPRGIKTHYLRVEFGKRTGEMEIRTFPVDQDDFARANEMGRVPITYVPGTPELSRVGGAYGFNRKPLYAAIGMFLLITGSMSAIQLLPNRHSHGTAN